MLEAGSFDLKDVYDSLIEDFGLELPDFPERTSIQKKSVSPGESAAFYTPGPDSVTVVNGNKDQEIMRNGGHELLHYSHAIKGAGETPKEVKDTLTELSKSVERAEKQSETQILDEINDMEDIRAAASVKVYKGDWDKFDPDTNGNKQEKVIEFVERHAEHSQIRKRYNYVKPFKDRWKEVMKLPISTESEAEAYFFSLYIKSRYLADENEEIDNKDILDILYGHNNDNDFCLYNKFGNSRRWDEEENAYIMDGIEQRINKYSELLEKNYTEKEAVGKILEEGLNNFERIGERILEKP